MSTEKITTLQELVDLHRKHINEPMSFPKSMWDGAFLNISPIARRVRKEMFASEFKIIEPRTSEELDLHYQNAIFLLPYQFEQKILFYKNTAAPMMFLAENYPNLRHTDIRLVHPPRNITSENRFLHESIHLLTFAKYFGKSVPYRYNPKFTYEEANHWILTHLAIEGSVLAIELMSTIVRPSMENVFICHATCYQAADHPKDYKTLLAAQQQVGLKSTYMLLARGFLLANLIVDSPAVKEEHIQDAIGPWKDFAGARDVVDRSLTLGDGFRRHSNSRYFSSLGFPHEFGDLPSLYYKGIFDAVPIINEIFEDNYQRFLVAAD